MTESKGRSKKKVLRLQVEFWERGKAERVYMGYTTDVSTSGLFLACHSPFKRGTPVEMRVKTEENLRIGGIVARVVRVPPAFRRIKTSGMGVHFDSPGEATVLRLEAMGKELSAEIQY